MHIIFFYREICNGTRDADVSCLMAIVKTATSDAHDDAMLILYAWILLSKSCYVPSPLPKLFLTSKFPCQRYMSRLFGELKVPDYVLSFVVNVNLQFTLTKSLDLYSISR